MPAEHVDSHINASLDWYVNQVFRSLKCLRAGDMVGYRLEAAESIRPLLQALFCLHDRRVMPYYKYLTWELEEFPLDKLRFTGSQLLTDVLQILTDADYQTQQKMLIEMESIFRSEGYNQVFDDLGGQGSMGDALCALSAQQQSLSITDDSTAKSLFWTELSRGFHRPLIE